MNKIVKELMMVAKEMKNIFGEEIEIGNVYQKKSGSRVYTCYPKLYSFDLDVLKDETTLEIVNKMSESLEREIQQEIGVCKCTVSILSNFIIPYSNSKFKIRTIGYINEDITEEELLKNGYKKIE